MQPNCSSILAEQKPSYLMTNKSKYQQAGLCIWLNVLSSTSLFKCMWWPNKWHWNDRIKQYKQCIYTFTCSAIQNNQIFKVITHSWKVLCYTTAFSNSLSVFWPLFTLSPPLSPSTVTTYVTGSLYFITSLQTPMRLGTV